MTGHNHNVKPKQVEEKLPLNFDNKNKLKEKLIL